MTGGGQSGCEVSEVKKKLKKKMLTSTPHAPGALAPGTLVKEPIMIKFSLNLCN
jgi:hypothetical protein